jgi:hypothetical protein
MDRRRPELQGAIALAVDGDRHIHHLHVLRRTDRAVRVRRDERKSKNTAIVVRGLTIEVNDGRHTVERRCKWLRNVILLSACERAACGARLGHFSIGLLGWHASPTCQLF